MGYASDVSLPKQALDGSSSLRAAAEYEENAVTRLSRRLLAALGSGGNTSGAPGLGAALSTRSVGLPSAQSEPVSITDRIPTAAANLGWPSRAGSDGGRPGVVALVGSPLEGGGASPRFGRLSLDATARHGSATGSPRGSFSNTEADATPGADSSAGAHIGPLRRPPPSPSAGGAMSFSSPGGRRPMLKKQLSSVFETPGDYDGPGGGGPGGGGAVGSDDNSEEGETAPSRSSASQLAMKSSSLTR